ncbi:hypothetical protein C0995_009729 [Termitomyces sp. Mi166|nr:hypothetical protein C0995_009729 [Termitomyces sp. Mi166\
MAPKISLLHVSPDASLLERELAAQKFIVAADAVFLKAQGLAMLAPLHETVFSLLEGLLDDWRLLNLMTIEWLRKAEVRQACINIWSLNKQVPWASEFGKMVMSWEHTISTIEQIKLMHFEKMAIELESTVPTVALWPIVNPVPTPVSTTSLIQRTPSEEVCAILGTLSLTQECSSQRSVPQNKGKGKAKVTEDDNNDKEATQKLRKELEDFVVLTTVQILRACGSPLLQAEHAVQEVQALLVPLPGCLLQPSCYSQQVLVVPRSSAPAVQPKRHS